MYFFCGSCIDSQERHECCDYKLFGFHCDIAFSVTQDAAQGGNLSLKLRRALIVDRQTPSSPGKSEGSTIILASFYSIMYYGLPNKIYYVAFSVT